MNSFDARDYFQKMYRIVGAAMTLHNELGHGFSEAVYQECLSILCQEEGIPWEREKKLTMHFHGQSLQKTYVADFVCYGDIVVELKAVSEVIPEHRAQLLNYLRITDSPAGVLINFGHPSFLVSEKYMFNPIKGEYDFVRGSM